MGARAEGRSDLCPRRIGERSVYYGIGRNRLKRWSGLGPGDTSWFLRSYPGALRKSQGV